MRDSGGYSRKIKKLYRAMKRKFPQCSRLRYEDPVDALVYAAVSECMTEAQAQSANRKLRDGFVDWNDLRVALPEEIVEVLGGDVTSARALAQTLKNILGAVFERYHTLTLEALRKIGKRPARQMLEKFAGATPFIVDFCMLTSLDGHAVPLTKRMVEYMRAAALVHPQADEETIEGFLTRQVPAHEACEFYLLLRQASESEKQKEKKSAAKK